MRYVDDDVIQFTPAQRVAHGVRLGTHPVGCPGRGDEVGGLGVFEEWGGGDENAVRDVAGIDGDAGVAVDEVADGGFDAVGHDH